MPTPKKTKKECEKCGRTMEQNNISSKQIWFGILLVVLLTAGYFIANQFTFNKESDVRQEIVKEIVKEELVKRYKN